jgi:hypothetical protein
MPYSLKASDAETLGGHPVSDFTLKNALPAGGTNITQINVGSGITGGGTGPTVTLGLSTSYLQSLGNQAYPQLTGVNTLTGVNKYTAGNLQISGSPALSVANVSASSPITVAASGNAIKIGLSDSALLTLGNGVYAQLGAANTFTKAQTFASGQTFPGTATLAGNNTFAGSNSFSKAITFANGQTFPGTGNGTITGITTTAPLSGSGTSGSIALSLNTSSLESTLNGVYAQLGAANTFTTNQLVRSSASHGIDSEDSSNGSAAVYGQDETADSSGVTGLGDTGTFGFAVGGGDENIGTLGVFSTFSNEFSTYLSEYANSGIGIGVWGDGGPGSVSGNGIIATSDSGNGIAAYAASQYAPIYGESDYVGSSQYAALFAVVDYNTGGACDIDIFGNMDCSGSFTGDNATSDNRQIETYSVQSSENWIEDFGSAHLASGRAVVSLDPTFVKIVNTGVTYHVFLTPKGESENLYVTNQSASGFEVREAHGGTSAIEFDYRIVAKRTGKESLRLVDKTEFNKNRHPSSLRDVQARNHQAGVAKRPLPAAIGGVKMTNRAAEPAKP